MALFQDKLFKILVDFLTGCQTDICLEIGLRALRNLGHPKTADYVGKYFCHKARVVSRDALESLGTVDPSHWTNEVKESVN